MKGVLLTFFSSSNSDLTARLLASFARVRPSGEGDKALGPLLLMLATAWPKEASAVSFGDRMQRDAPPLTRQRQESFDLVEKHIGTGELDNAMRVKTAIGAAKKAGKETLSWETLKDECGVGIVQGEKEIKETLATFLKEHSDEILTGRYPVANRLRSKFSPLLKWAERMISTCAWYPMLTMCASRDITWPSSPLQWRPVTQSLS